MPLVANSIAELLTALKCDRSTDDHRRAPRIGLRARVTIVPHADGQFQAPVEAWVRDISAGGIGLLHSQPLQVGQAFLVRLPNHGQEVISVLCQVVHSQSVGDNLCRIGARFTCEPFQERQPGQAGSAPAATQDRAGGGGGDRAGADLGRLRRALRCST